METLFCVWEQLDRWCVGYCVLGHTDSWGYKFECVPLVYDFSACEVLQSYPGGSEDETIVGELTITSESLIITFPLTLFLYV